MLNNATIYAKETNSKKTLNNNDDNDKMTL